MFRLSFYIKVLISDERDRMNSSLFYILFIVFSLHVGLPNFFTSLNIWKVWPYIMQVIYHKTLKTLSKEKGL